MFSCSLGGLKYWLVQFFTVGSGLVGWLAPEYLEARLKEQEHQRRLSEVDARLVERTHTPVLERLRSAARRILKESV